jgi:iron(III) transport system substrate-binding protein
VLAACAPAASTGGAPTAGPVAASPEWDALVRAAKAEGKIVIAGPRGDDRQKALTETFEDRYGIAVEYLGTGGPELPPRVQKEREAGLYLWDVFIAGTTTLLHGLKAVGAVEPIEPMLVLPDVKDPRNWRGGELPFFDKDRVGLSILRQAGQYVYVNTSQVNPDEFTSWRVLLDPKYKGQILVGRDPRVSGYGRSTFLYFYIEPSMGTDFIRELVKQDITFLRDDRLATQQLGQGKFPICVCSDTDTDRLIKEGIPIKALDPRRIKEGTHVTSAYANVAVANRAPHPNAAKLYTNWVLSQEAGLLFSRATGSPSLRMDVSIEHVDPALIPQPQWPITNTEDVIEREEPLVEFMRGLLGGG